MTGVTLKDNSSDTIDEAQPLPAEAVAMPSSPVVATVVAPAEEQQPAEAEPFPGADLAPEAEPVLEAEPASEAVESEAQAPAPESIPARAASPIEKFAYRENGIDALIMCGETPQRAIISFSSMNPGKFER